MAMILFRKLVPLVGQQLFIQNDKGFLSLLPTISHCCIPEHGISCEALHLIIYGQAYKHINFFKTKKT